MPCWVTHPQSHADVKRTFAFWNTNTRMYVCMYVCVARSQSTMNSDAHPHTRCHYKNKSESQWEYKVSMCRATQSHHSSFNPIPPLEGHSNIRTRIPTHSIHINPWRSILVICHCFDVYLHVILRLADGSRHTRLRLAKRKGPALYVCMYVCVCICVYAWLMLLCVRSCTNVWICLLSWFILLHSSLCVYVCMHVCMYVCVCVCM